MGKKLIDLAGSKIGRLAVIEVVPSRGRGARWLCRCNCGNEKTVSSTELRFGNTRSCGCLRKESASSLHAFTDKAACAERTSARNFKHGHSFRGRLAPEYTSWRAMLTRCDNPNAKDFHLWGGKVSRSANGGASLKTFCRIWVIGLSAHLLIATRTRTATTNHQIAGGLLHSSKQEPSAE